MLISGPTGLDVAAQVQNFINRPWTMGDLITFTNATTEGTKFNDNVKCQFGTTALGYIEQNGTDLIIDPDTVGAGIIKFGSAADKNVQLNKIGLGTTAVSALFWVNFIQVTSAGRGALQFDYTYTGSGPSANILSKLTFQGSAAAPLALPATFEVIKDQDQTGSGVYGVRSIIGTSNTRSITQALSVSTFFGYKAQRGSVGTANTGGTVIEYGFWMPTFTAYTGLTSYIIWGVNVGHDIQVQDNLYYLFGGSDTVKGTTRMRWNTGGSTLDTEIASVVTKTLSATTETYTDAINIAVGSTTGTKIGTATTQKLGFWNKTPVVQPAAYTPTNVTTDRSYDANVTTIDELADVLGTLIADLQSIGLVG